MPVGSWVTFYCGKFWVSLRSNGCPSLCSRDNHPLELRSCHFMYPPGGEKIFIPDRVGKKMILHNHLAERFNSRRKAMIYRPISVCRFANKVCFICRDYILECLCKWNEGLVYTYQVNRVFFYTFLGVLKIRTIFFQRTYVQCYLGVFVFVWRNIDRYCKSIKLKSFIENKGLISRRYRLVLTCWYSALVYAFAKTFFFKRDAQEQRITGNQCRLLHVIVLCGSR